MVIDRGDRRPAFSAGLLSRANFINVFINFLLTKLSMFLESLIIFYCKINIVLYECFVIDI